MNLRLLITLFFAVPVVAVSQAQPYPQNYFGNPIDTPFVLAGTFGEIRNDHFHSGIDFSTGNEQGKPVYAAADGYVSRIKVSAVGFGKAIYVTHPNGFVTVYGHLKKYEEAVEKYVRKLQYKNEQFELDAALEPNKIKVKKGAVIAWTGNTGSSTGPHLHFEIRDEKTEEPVNPLLFGYSVSDTIAPVIKEVRLYPVPSQGVVVDSDRPRSYDVVKTSSGYGVQVSDYIQAFGKIGFEFSLADYQNNNPSPLGLYSIQLTVDTQQMFTMQYDRMNFNDSRYVNAHIDYAAKYDDDGIYERCFRLTGDKLKFYGDTVGFGYFEFLQDGVHDISLTVKDYNGNAAHLNFQILSYSSLSNAEYMQQPEDYFVMVPEKGLAIHKSDVEITIPANSLYETLLFTNSRSSKKTGYYSSTFEIGDPHVPLHLPMTVSLRPQDLHDDWKPRAVLVSFDKKGKQVYEGNDWKNEFISARTRHFGTFAVAIDSVPPQISLVSLPGDQHAEGPALRLLMQDSFSGIKSYRATLDGKWLMMEYDSKRNLLFSDAKEIPANKNHLLEVVATDQAGNTNTFRKEFSYSDK